MKKPLLSKTIVYKTCQWCGKATPNWGTISVRMYDPIRRYSSGRKVQSGAKLTLCPSHYEKVRAVTEKSLTK